MKSGATPLVLPHIPGGNFSNGRFAMVEATNHISALCCSPLKNGPSSGVVSVNIVLKQKRGKSRKNSRTIFIVGVTAMVSFILIGFLFPCEKTISEEKLFRDEAATIGEYIKEIKSTKCFLVRILSSSKCQTIPILH
jgi:2',3'-cyclic-nucleotide 2'-phosphodiesterase (5'-nucleotidase family)